MYYKQKLREGAKRWWKWDMKMEKDFGCDENGKKKGTIVIIICSDVADVMMDDYSRWVWSGTHQSNLTVGDGWFCKVGTITTVC